MNLSEITKTLPDIKKVVSILSGGLDSTTLTYLLVHRYGADNVFGLTYNYGQKQIMETAKAQFTCADLHVAHKILDISFLGDIVGSVSANVQGTKIDMPTIQEVLGSPQPPTYIPFRNQILLSIGFTFAESNKCEGIFTALQSQDMYSYWDTQEAFIKGLNSIAALNRQHNIQIYAPFNRLDKATEIAIGTELGVNYACTLTCYNPLPMGVSCGICPSCAERIQGFKKNNMVDPIKYAINIKW